ncbi:site-specific integrase [Methylolobus aquaticus]|nr:site-specific integrase [Methylolobus aquaticus]
MAKAKLKALDVQRAKEGIHDDGGGLRLVVGKTGTKRWLFRLTVNGKRREIAVGRYPELGLEDARLEVAEIRKAARQGVDPKAKPAEPAAVPTFTSAAAQYIRAHRHGWRNAKHARQWTATLKTYARPVIGSVPVDQITTEHVLRILQPIWTNKTETGKRVQGRIENVLDAAAARKWRDPVNPARWRGHLDKLLASPKKVKKPVHRPAMPYRDLPGFMADLTAKDSVSSAALRFLILTGCRTGEVIGAQWSEIDTEAATWTIPGDRMKAGREHRVPLPREALGILEGLPRIAGNPYVFPGARHARPLSSMALLQLMRGMGHGVGGTLSEAVPHGFRSTFRDWASEQTATPHAVMEAALAHVISDGTVAAYARSDLYQKRAALMQQWASYCATAPAANVVPLRRGA